MAWLRRRLFFFRWESKSDDTVIDLVVVGKMVAVGGGETKRAGNARGKNSSVRTAGRVDDVNKRTHLRLTGALSHLRRYCQRIIHLGRRDRRRRRRKAPKTPTAHPALTVLETPHVLHVPQMPRDGLPAPRRHTGSGPGRMQESTALVLTLRHDHDTLALKPCAESKTQHAGLVYGAQRPR